MNTKPYVGQHVKLRRETYKELKLDSIEAFEQSKHMIITYVGENIGYDHEPIYVIHVNQPLINHFLLDASMVDPI